MFKFAIPASRPASPSAECGNRQANCTLFHIALNRLRWDPPTKAYAARRTAEGTTKRKILRCLKRFIAREVYRLLQAGSLRLATTGV